MRVEYINPFISSLSNTFSIMAGVDVQREQIVMKKDSSFIHEISGVIGLSGRAAGAIVLSVSEKLALRVASKMLMTEIKEINDDVLDAIGELTNVIAGSAKSELEELHLNVSLPNVITGNSHDIRFPSNVTPICVQFSSEWGDLALEVGLEDVV